MRRLAYPISIKHSRLSSSPAHQLRNLYKWMEAHLHEPSSNVPADPEALHELNTDLPRPNSVHSAHSSEISPTTSPPYWVQSHTRSFSNISVESHHGGITLQDNTEGEDSKNDTICWAKSVHIEDHVVVNGGRTGIGAFVVWNITVETLRVCACYFAFNIC
jgi:hypothetical protein